MGAVAREFSYQFLLGAQLEKDRDKSCAAWTDGEGTADFGTEHCHL
jgi:hypothetical protein